MLLWVGAALALGVGVALLASRDPGYVLIHWAGWQVESRSLVVAVVLLAVLFFALHWLLNLGSAVRGTSRRWRQYSALRRRARARRSLVKGLLELAEGHWQQAERLLMRHAEDAETPLLHYLAAARAAGQLGARERRDRYLAKAHETAPGADVAIGLSQAEEQYRSGQYEQSLATLRHLRTLVPKHPHVLQMLLRAYGALRDHRAQLELLPQLRRARLLPEDELRRLERGCYRALLAETQDPASVWASLPRDLQRDATLLSDYAQLLHRRGQAAQALALLQNQLRSRWDSELAALYGRLAEVDPETHLAVAQRWARRHGEDPGLLLTLARLEARAGRLDEAAGHFERAIRLQPGAEARRDYGRLLERLGDTRGAMEQFRDALEQELQGASGGQGRIQGRLPTLTAAEAAAEYPA